jgi:carboxy-terminal domain RNA polymerase II polypeptide A small phosphatase
MKGRKTLVLDIDETLVHSQFQDAGTADIVLSIDIEGRKHNIFI